MRRNRAGRRIAAWTSCSIHPIQRKNSLHQRRSQLRPVRMDTTCPASVQRKTELRSLQWTQQFQWLQQVRPWRSPHLSLQILRWKRFRHRLIRAIQIRTLLLQLLPHSKFNEVSWRGLTLNRQPSPASPSTPCRLSRCSHFSSAATMPHAFDTGTHSTHRA